MNFVFRIVFLLAGSVLPSDPPQQSPLFYRNLPWGTEAQFNPASMIVNEGLDIGQLRTAGGSTRLIPSALNFQRLNATLSHPVTSIRRSIGSDAFLHTEVIPSSLEKGRAQWVPNYQLHLLGGGLLNARLEEWYIAHGYQNPKAAAFVTSMTAAYLNEAQEIEGHPDDYATDPVADLYLFDLAGIAVFQSRTVREFFHSQVEWMNWPLQPSIWTSNMNVRQAGQYHAFRIHAPWKSDWSLFYHVGLGNIGGLSRRLDRDHHLSVGAGYYALHLVPSGQGQSSVVLAPKLGLFWDREGSLLASAFWNSQSQERFTVSMHPGALKNVPFGGWVAFGGERGLGMGLTMETGFGIVAPGSFGESRREL